MLYLSYYKAYALCFFTFISFNYSIGQESIFTSEKVTFYSQETALEGTIVRPIDPYAAVVIVHGSGQTPRLIEFAEQLAEVGITVLTYDKRGVGESGGIYAGPEVGTNNIDASNLDLLANDVSAAVDILHKKESELPIGLIGFSQAGWIIPMAAKKNPLVNFMVLFSCPTITTLEQLRFQFYTNGNEDFWKNHTEEDARYHVKNDPDRYQFVGTDPKDYLSALSTPGLWIFGQKDIQIPVGMCMDQLNSLKSKGGNFEYCVFSDLGHNTAFADTSSPVDISIQWIKQEVECLKD